MNKLMIGLTLTSTLVFANSIKGQQQKPNFILIMADDLGYGDIGCYGNTQIKTPVLDQMAKDGIRFTDYHSNGAVCSPTRVALMTDKYQQRIGATGVITAKKPLNTGMPLKETTIAVVLKKSRLFYRNVRKMVFGISCKIQSGTPRF